MPTEGVAEVKTYQARAFREGAWWAIDIPELDLATQARRLDQAEHMVRDVIATWLEVAPDSFSVFVVPELDSEVSKAAVAVRKATRDAAAAVEAAAVSTRAFAADLLRKGYTVRDAGAILGVSPQRISQLTANVEHKTPAKKAASHASPPAQSRSNASRTLAKGSSPATKKTAAKVLAPARSSTVITRFKNEKGAKK